MPVSVIVPADINSGALSSPQNYELNTNSDKLNVIYRRVLAVKDNIDRLACIMCLGTALSAICLIYIIVLHDRLSKMNDNMLSRFDNINGLLGNITHI